MGTTPYKVKIVLVDNIYQDIYENKVNFLI